MNGVMVFHATVKILLLKRDGQYGGGNWSAPRKNTDKLSYTRICQCGIKLSGERPFYLQAGT